jgi:hypothetical protein
LQYSSARTERLDLRVCGWIIRRNGAIPTFSDDFIIENEHRTNRNLALLLGRIGQLQCPPHEVDV